MTVTEPLSGWLVPGGLWQQLLLDTSAPLRPVTGNDCRRYTHNVESSICFLLVLEMRDFLKLKRSPISYGYWQ
jgi:hypothetical protein